LDRHVAVPAVHGDLYLVAVHDRAAGRRAAVEHVLGLTEGGVVIVAGHAVDEAPLDRGAQRGGDGVGPVTGDDHVYAHLSIVGGDLHEGGEPLGEVGVVVGLSEGGHPVDQQQDTRGLGFVGELAVLGD